MANVPDKPRLEGLETKWDGVWEEERTYAFTRPQSRSEVYVVDTPPPTVSGSLHLGTVFGYVQFDAMARYHRMRGEHVFFPMGWDDNGLPTERRVQNHHNVRCDPTIPRGTQLEPDERSGLTRISRPDFIDLCTELTLEDEKGFEQVFRDVGMSVDWTLTYATIGTRSRRVAQQAFLRNLARGEAYASEAPTSWDVDFQTAVAQAEFDDRMVNGAFHKIAFAGPDGDLLIETTRPELLPACVALVVHPDDERWAGIVGSTATSPLFGVRIPVVAHELAQPDKGTGMAMVCTFGDQTDIIWWRELDLPVRAIVQRDGRLLEAQPEWIPAAATEAWGALSGKTVKAARRQVVELLAASGDLRGEPQPITHEVRFYEKGERPLEIVTSRQWYIRNGARDESLSAALLEAGRALVWHPEFMRTRFEHWVEGLNTDWLISRQRYFGVPLPLWYRIDADGEVLWDEVLVPDVAALPIDPQVDVPAGFDEAARGAPGGFVGDLDVMDTWATSSLTPQIVGGWEDDDELFALTFPADLRPQGPEIIRTWLFSTLLRSHLEHGQLPWRNASINGWILDPDRKKMSKSFGNVITPAALVEEHGADGLRYWACSAAPGVDTAVDAGQMRVGRRLATKLLNVSRFVLGLSDGAEPGPVTDPLDIDFLGQLADVVDVCTDAFDRYRYSHALATAEPLFWRYCDEYVELVKSRAYDDATSGSAVAALSIALSTFQRLFAPFLPFVTAEVWSWWQDGSVHRSPWPDAGAIRAQLADEGVPDAFAVASQVLKDIRKTKSEAHRGMRTEVTRLVVAGPAETIAAFSAVRDDVLAAGVVGRCEVNLETAYAVEVELAVPS